MGCETWGVGELEHAIGMSWYLENEFSMTSIVVNRHINF